MARVCGFVRQRLNWHSEHKMYVVGDQGMSSAHGGGYAGGVTIGNVMTQQQELVRSWG